MARDHFRSHYLDFSAPTPREVGGVLQRHRNKLIAATVLLGGSVAFTAFGWVPGLHKGQDDIAQTSTTVSAEAPSGLVVAEDLQATELPMLAHTRTQRGDTVRSLLQRLGVEDPSAEAQLREMAAVRQVLNDEPRSRVQAQTNAQGQLQSLRFTWLDKRSDENAQVLSVEAQADGAWQSREDSLPLSMQTRLISGRIQSSLFAATDALDVPDSIAIAVAELFATEIDFRRDLRKQDRFTVAYEEWLADGEVMRTGRVLGAEFVNKGKTLQAIWFAPKDEYFDAQGQSSKRQFLPSPMKFSRVTSGFAMRFHPIKKEWKRHLGVDYGAPTGTPVRAIGAGRVAFAGRQRGYGNVVEIQHDENNRTLYAHLSKIYVRKGQRVDREENIGAVGATGWATGPHLHFEVKVNGKHQDPLKFAQRSKALTLSKTDLAQFQPVAQSMLQTLAAAAATETASAQ